MRGRDKKNGHGEERLVAVLHKAVADKRAGAPVSAERHRILAQSIRSGVLPELARRISDGDPRHIEPIGEDEVDRCIALLLDEQHRSFVEFQILVEDLVHHSVPVFSYIFHPIARRLGRMWLQDSANFFEITLGSSRLQTIVREALSAGNDASGASGEVPRIFFARAGSDTHTLGLMIVCGCFREAGWSVHGGSEFEIGPDVLEELASANYVALGLSLGPNWRAIRLEDLILKARKRSRNPAIKVIVGGLAAEDARETLGHYHIDWALNEPDEALRRINEVVGA